MKFYPNEIKKVLIENQERFAKLEHERWAHWQSYLHSQCEKLADGSLRIPPDLVARWERQIRTNFVDLSDKEKASDLEQVEKFLQVVEDVINKELK